MSQGASGTFHVGETWYFEGEARDADDQALDLTGASGTLKIRRKSVLVFERAVTIDDAAAGKWSLVITPAEQSAAGVLPEAHKMELYFVLGDSSVTVQNTGTLTLLGRL